MYDSVTTMPFPTTTPAPRLSLDQRFEVVYGDHADAVYRYLSAMVPHPSDRDDCFQETWIKVHRALERYTDQGTPFAWVCTIARNTVRDWYRRRSRLKVVEQVEETPTEHDPGNQVAVAEQAQVMQRAVMSLSPKLREVYVLRIEEGLSFKEIAQVTGEPADRLMGRMKMATKQLSAAWKSCQEVQ